MKREKKLSNTHWIQIRDTKLNTMERKRPPLVNSHRNEKRVTVYTDFLDFLRVNGKKITNSSFKFSLVLRGLDEKSLHIFLATKPNIKNIEFVETKNEKQKSRQKGFVDGQREKLKGFDISVSSFSVERAIQRVRGLGLEL